MDPNSQYSPSNQPSPAPPPSSNHPPHLHPMVVLQPGERVVCELRRHPIGIILVYLGALFAIGVLTALAFTVLPSMLPQTVDSSGLAQVYLGAGLLLTLIVLVLGVATSIYWQNQWVITTDSITQITQSGLFSRQVSQLSMDNLEDVTVDQHGLLPHLLNYGILKVESAGERSKFMFTYCPTPNKYARDILEVHEQFLEERRNIQQTTRTNMHTNSSQIQ